MPAARRTAGCRLALGLSHASHLFDGDERGVVQMATLADRVGVDVIVLSEHVLLGEDPVSHPGAGTPFPFPPDHSYPDPLVMLATMAGVTERIRLSTGVAIAPLRPAAILAKMAATLDVVSGGRLDLGVGVGWHHPEFDAVGIPMAGLGKRLEDTVAACQVLWRGGPSSFRSPTVTFTDVYCHPTPVQQGGIPVWFGGGATPATAGRIARLGAGWVVIGSTPIEDIATGVTLIRQQCENAGRDPDEIGVRCSLPITPDADATVRVRRAVEAMIPLVEAGATVVQVGLSQLVRHPSEAEDVLSTLVKEMERS